MTLNKRELLDLGTKLKRIKNALNTIDNEREKIREDLQACIDLCLREMDRWSNIEMSHTLNDINDSMEL